MKWNRSSRRPRESGDPGQLDSRFRGNDDREPHRFHQIENRSSAAPNLREPRIWAARGAPECPPLGRAAPFAAGSGAIAPPGKPAFPPGFGPASVLPSGLPQSCQKPVWTLAHGPVNICAIECPKEQCQPFGAF